MDSFIAGACFVIFYLAIGVAVDVVFSWTGLGELGDLVVVTCWPVIVFVGSVLAFGWVCIKAARFYKRLVGGAIVLLIASTANATQPHCNNVQRAKVAAVAVPVITNQVQILRTFPQAFYTTDQYGSAYGAQANGSNEQTQLLREILAELQSQNGGRAQAADPLSLVRKSCNKCHSGPGAKSGFHTDGDMSTEDRMLAIERMLEDDASRIMPKGTKLDPNLRGKIIQQLSRRPATDTPPPPPEPERVD